MRVTFVTFLSLLSVCARACAVCGGALCGFRAPSLLRSVQERVCGPRCHSGSSLYTAGRA